MKALIIDDERLAREELRLLLSERPQIEIIGEAPNATIALELIQKTSPDLLFLDISMPGKNGFELLEALPIPHPKVVFTTAHGDHAIQAFEVNALDYLLKPISPKRLSNALDRLFEGELHLETQPSNRKKNIPLTPNDRVFVKDGERCWFVSLHEITLLELEGKYTRLYFGSQKPLIHRSLIAMEERLPSDTFLRANRSQIVNLNCIQSIDPWFSGALKANLTNGQSVELSRRQSQLFRDRMSL